MHSFENEIFFTLNILIEQRTKKLENVKKKEIYQIHTLNETLDSQFLRFPNINPFQALKLCKKKITLKTM